METRMVPSGGIRVKAVAQGPATGPDVLFVNSLGSTMAIWDDVVARLPDRLRVVRFDLRGHGASDVPPGRYGMGTLVSDAEAVCDAFGLRDALVVGLSVGGMIAQGLAVKRLDLVRALVLSNTAARIGTPKVWQERIDQVLEGGMPALVPGIMERWFGPTFRTSAAAVRWRDMLLTCDPVGYAGVCAAISGTDFYATTASLRLPTLGIAGSADGSTPPDLVRETVDLIPGSRFALIRKAGHLPCVEAPDEHAALLVEFMAQIGHLP